MARRSRPRRGRARIRGEFVRRTTKWAAITAALLLGAGARSAAQADSGWRFSVVPYFWASDLTGNVGIGPIETHVDKSFRDIVHVLKFGAMIAGDVRYRSYVFGLDAIYSHVGNATTVAFRGDTARSHSARKKRFSIRRSDTSSITEPGTSNRFWASGTGT